MPMPTIPEVCDYIIAKIDAGFWRPYQVLPIEHGDEFSQGCGCLLQLMWRCYKEQPQLTYKERQAAEEKTTIAFQRARAEQLGIEVISPTDYRTQSLGYFNDHSTKEQVKELLVLTKERQGR